MGDINVSELLYLDVSLSETRWLLQPRLKTAAFGFRSSTITNSGLNLV